MTMRMNAYGLSQIGYMLVAAYEVYLKGQKRLNIECYKKDNSLLVRRWTTGSTAWINEFNNRDDANAEVIRLIKSRVDDGGWFKRTL